MNQFEEIAAVEPYSLEILDDLIDRYYRAIMAQIEDEPDKLKMGELLKMIELRIKQTPTDQKKKQFWDMIENVRREYLTGTKKRSTEPVSSGRKGDRRRNKS